eukprot:5924622-Alexandrium_andersonii.AAC.1
MRSSRPAQYSNAEFARADSDSGDETGSLLGVPKGFREASEGLRSNSDVGSKGAPRGLRGAARGLQGAGL